MCFGGGTQQISTPEPPPVTPAPTPSPLPAAVAEKSPGPQDIAAQDRRKKIAAIRYGMLSTIKTSPQGVPGLTPTLGSTDTQGKKTLGS